MISIRPVRVSDFAALVAIETHPETAPFLGRTGLTWHRDAYASSTMRHLVAEKDGGPVGFAVLAALDDSRGTAELRRIAVADAAKGAGIGRMLLRSALHQAVATHGAGRIWLDVKSHNHRARSLYASEGFRLTPPETVAALGLRVTTLPSGVVDPELVVMMRPLRRAEPGDDQPVTGP